MRPEEAKAEEPNVRLTESRHRKQLPRRRGGCPIRFWPRQRWRWALFAMLGYVLVSSWIALPSGSRLRDRALWEHPSTQRQFEAWAALLSGIGFECQAAPLRERLWELTQAYLDLRQTWVWPVQALALQMGVDQSFRMFSNPQTTPSLLVVELDRGDGFEPLYVAKSSEHRWRAAQLEHHRIRKLVGRVARGSYGAQWRALGRWLARRASCDFPRARRLRTRLYRSRTVLTTGGEHQQRATAPPPIPADYARTHEPGRFTKSFSVSLHSHPCDE